MYDMRVCFEVICCVFLCRSGNYISKLQQESLFEFGAELSPARAKRADTRTVK